MNKEQVIGLLRHLLPFIDGMATARGWITQEGWTVLSEQTASDSRARYYHCWSRMELLR
jgi:hypothetical protein